MSRYDEIRAAWEARQKARADAQAPTTAMAKASAVSAEHLTGTDEWDRYLAQVQALLEEAQTICAQSKEDAVRVVSVDDHRKVLNTFHYYQGAVDAYTRALSLPKEVIAHGRPDAS